jgi:glutamate synthase (NADPH/NADH) large chain
MMRKCHLNTCPVGIATQDPRLREKFVGTPEHVVNYFFFVAEELREIMAGLGLRTVDEMVGRADLLKPRIVDRGKAGATDLSRLLRVVDPSAPRRFVRSLRKPNEQRLDDRIVAALDGALPVLIEDRVGNADRSVGAYASGEVARRFGGAGLPDGSVTMRLTGSAGQSFGAFLARGLTLDLVGDGNDYVGKGLSGGRLIVRQPDWVTRDAADNIVIGNTCLYGATDGEAFFAGVAGERFAVRNSGATAVVEGTGDHGCEYMTGGMVVVLGDVGRNFAAGMSGGIALVWDPGRTLDSLANLEGVALEAVDDLGLLKSLIERHAELTGSARAAAILDDWPSASGQFVQVMPHEYRRVLDSGMLAAE